MTKGGPLHVDHVVVYYLFDLAFQKGFAGYAAAVAYVLFVAILVLTVVQLCDRPADGALLVMSASRRRARRRQPRPAAAAAVQPWHLLLAPIALVMVTPLAVDARHVDRDAGRDAPLPARAHPVRHPLAELPDGLHEAPFGRWFINTMVVTVACVVGNLVFCSLAGYAFARLRFVGQRTSPSS